MEKLSKNSQAVKIASLKGYYIDKEGNCFGPKGILKLGKDRAGYYRIYIKTPGQSGNCSTQIKIHRLQAYQKFGDKIFEPGIEVRHLNGVRDDNTWGNIEIGTSSDNSFDKPKELRIKMGKRAASFLKKLSDDKLKEFRSDFESGYSNRMLREKYGLARSTVSYICNHKTYNS